MAMLCAAVLVPGLSCAQSRSPMQGIAQPSGPAAVEARQTHGSVDVIALGDGAQRVYVFLPADPGLSGKVPMVFFAHGWQGMNPKNYGALIDHLAREGEVVIFAVYQEDDATSPQGVTATAAAAEQRALAELKRRGLEPDSRRVVYFGYSMGAAISLRLAARPQAGLPMPQAGLPMPQALVLAAPGDAIHVAKGEAAKSIWPDMKQLPKTLPIAIVTGEDDKAIGLPSGRKLAAELCRVTRPGPSVLLVLPSDEHGGTKVNAGHGSPGAPDSRYDFDLHTPASAIPSHIAGREGFEASASLNQLDFFGYWRVLDAVIDSLAAAPSTSTAYVPPRVVFGEPGNKGFSAVRLDLGTWPDGTPYKAGFSENVCLAK